MAYACSAPYFKRCGTFGHDTDGCEVECKRCGGKHGTRECFRKRSYVAAARSFPPANGSSSTTNQTSGPAPPNPSAPVPGLQVLKAQDPAPHVQEDAQLLRWRRA
ncbi:hypothetical protein HPB52_022895 [Rhipicephalus sanguineus]|uniref:Uncharacterized protein n=1 Tax=Rhipicephalus sanguineus TaxID=34632 RepID=A0A9D4Q3D6_RHISA|nr:hypothetical protein HPB52_022895 [Rhipicephalus sanguineus]